MGSRWQLAGVVVVGDVVVRTWILGCDATGHGCVVAMRSPRAT